MAEEAKDFSVPKIGVYVCHCGSNIAKQVDVFDAVEYAKTLPNVAVAREYKFMCSEPGQDIIKKDIREMGLTRVVVAACSPLMHELTFRKTAEAADLNQYLVQIANVREQVAWVTKSKEAATIKAKALIHGAVNKATYLEPLQTRKVEINPATLVVGGGIAGIQAALDIADAGFKVYLVERDSTIGGNMARFDKTFPTLDCAACILTPKMVSVAHHENITILASSNVEDVSGYIGNFKVKVRKQPRYVDIEKCTACTACWNACPTSLVPVDRKIMLGEQLVNTSSRL
ncbi:MAG TPA: FAD-dependent oxidoreductase [Acidobacteriota bacterium]|nr:FAD-dependent oxidoreductase [Acidobacteriota bacterium]